VPWNRASAPFPDDTRAVPRPPARAPTFAGVPRPLAFIARIWLTLLAAWALYLAAGNAFIATGLLARAVSWDPDTVTLDYDRAWTLWPGQVTVHGYRLRGQDSVLEYSVEVDRGDLWVDLLALFDRKFHATRVRAEGYALRVRLKRTAAEADAGGMGNLPAIPPYVDPPLLPIGAPRPAVDDAHYDLWTAHLEDIDASVREVWIDGVRVTGEGRVRGAFYFRPLRMVQVGPLALDVKRVEATVLGAPVAENLQGRIDVTLGAVARPGDAAAETFLRALDGGVALEGLLPADGLAALASRRAPVRIADASGQVTARARIHHGVVMPGSRLRAATEHLVLGSRDGLFSAAVGGQLFGEVRGTRARGPMATVRIVLSSGAASIATAAPGLLLDEGWLELRPLSADLTRATRFPGAEGRVRARLPDLVRLQPAASRAGALVVDGGHGTLRAGLAVEPDTSSKLDLVVDARDAAARLERWELAAGSARIRADLAVTAGGAARGSLQVDAERAEARSEALRYAGDVALRAKLLRSDDGPDVRAEDVALRTHGTVRRRGATSAARAAVHLPALVLEDGKPLRVEGSAKVALDDLRVLQGLRGHNLQLGRGAGSVEASFGYDGQAQVLAGAAVFDARGGARWGGVAMRGRVHGAVERYRIDLKRREAEVRGAGLRLRDVDLWMGDSEAEIAAWWADVRAPSAHLSWRDDTILRATDFSADCRDGEPLLELLAAADSMPAWVGDVLHLPRLRARGSLATRGERVAVEMNATAEGASMQASLRHDGTLDAAALLRLGLLSAGLRVTDGETSLSLLAGDGWLRRERAELAQAAR
jgi:hypothetical protein